MSIRRRPASPPQLLVRFFLGLIAVGTALLCLPAAATGRSLTPVQALFTATSAVCVTGLIVVDTPSALSLFGQLVVLGLIQLGGLGYMTLTTVVAVALGKRLTVQERLALQEGLSVDGLDGLLRFSITVLKLTLVAEGVGALLLLGRWWPDHGFARAAYLAVFHAVSAWNNAGFSLFSSSLVGYRGDVVVNAVVMALIVAGGLGYLVLVELLRLRRPARLSLHTRLVLTVTAVLVGGGAVAVFLLERTNPATLGALVPGEALLASTFQAITPRTAGFNTLDTGALRPATLFLVMALMFVGAAPGGTAGGIKVTTAGITLLALWATARGRADAVVFRRRLSPEAVTRALFIGCIAFLTVNLVAALLLTLEGRDLLPVLFETISAFGTVGLSMGGGPAPVSLAGHLSPGGQLLLTGLMFAGRLGPLTLAVALARARSSPLLRHPEGKVLIG
jgi:trk system potassium uptake protein TrkH